MLRTFRKYKLHAEIVNNLEKLENKDSQFKKSISESFKHFMDETIPEMEKAVEINMLNSLYHKLKSEDIKTELLNSYKRRQLDLQYNLIKPEVNVEEKKRVEVDELVHMDYFTPNIKDISLRDLNKFMDFPFIEFEYVFPSMNYGFLYWFDKIMVQTNRFSSQINPESFKIIKMLERQMKLRSMTMDELKIREELDFVKTKEDLEETFKNRNIYLKLIYTIGDDLRTVLEQYRFHEIGEVLFTHSFLYDALVNILVWQMYRPEVKEILLDETQRVEALNNIVKQILDHPDSVHFMSYDLENWFDLQKFLKLNKDVIINLDEEPFNFDKNPHMSEKYGLNDFNSYNSNLLLYGREGSGKSGVLMSVTMWARYNDWVIFKMPSAFAVTQSRVEDLDRHEKSRLYVNPECSAKLVEDFYVSNVKKLKDMPVNPALYGNYNIVGVHKDEKEPVPNFYIEDRQIYFYDSDQFIEPELLEMRLRENDIYDRSLKDELPQPANLAELCEYVLKNPILSISALAEIKEQLYNQEQEKILVVVDDFNWLYRPSATHSFRYVNIKGNKGRVPPYHIALCRLFMNFDGHKIKNGFKLAASSNYSVTKHKFYPAKIKFPNSSSYEMKGMDLETFRYFYQFALNHSIDLNSSETAVEIENWWMQTQGNYKEFIRIMQFSENNVYG